jgi:deoxyribonuclease IV
MSRLLFGTAGIPLSTSPPTTINGVKRVAGLGLDCMELEFVRGIYLKEPEVKTVAGIAAEQGIRLSAHAPYYINLNAREPLKLRQGQGMLRNAARIAWLSDAKSIVVHPGFYMGDAPQDAFRNIMEHLEHVQMRLEEEGIGIKLRVETSGKKSQFGSFGEILDICAATPAIAPCLDFAHLHAYEGKVNTYAEFSDLLTRVREKLGETALGDMHLHISGIAYGKLGEKSHLPLEESDLDYKELLRALRDAKAEGMVICESPNQEEDALLLKRTYESLRLNQ